MKRRVLIVVSALALAPLARPASAADFKHSEPAFVPVHDCTCRANGESVQLGESRCLVTPEGPRTAQCVMEQNVTSWHILQNTCPQASRTVSHG